MFTSDVRDESSDLPLRLRRGQFNMQITEVIFNMLQFCDAFTIAKTLSVSKEFHVIGTSNLLWRQVLEHKEDYFLETRLSQETFAQLDQVDVLMEDPDDCIYRDALRPLLRWSMREDLDRERVVIRKSEKCRWLTMAMIMSVFFPPAGIFLQYVYIEDHTPYGESGENYEHNKLREYLNIVDGVIFMLICIGLTLCGWIPGILFALLIFGFWNLRESCKCTMYCSPGLILIGIMICLGVYHYFECCPMWCVCKKCCKPITEFVCQCCSDVDVSDCCCCCLSSNCYDDPCEKVHDFACECMLCQ